MRAPELYHFRDNNGREIDLLHRHGRELVGAETKSASTLHARLRAGLTGFDARVAPLARRLLVYNGPARRYSDGVEAVNFRDFGGALAQLHSD